MSVEPSPTTWLVLDFDGTITEVDLLDEMARTFGDPAVYLDVEEGLHGGTITLQECITREFRPVTVPIDEMVAWVHENIAIRPGLPELVADVEGRDYGVRVLSSGFEEIIAPVLERIGVGHVEILANRLDPRPDGWRVIWRDESVCPVCGEACKRAGLPTGEVVYVGDGISDRCAALRAERIFATRGLAQYLDSWGVSYERFVDFHDVRRALVDQ
jgi:2-hydroxy-3-keto-5-methylthiopentenyl-1-phosphate phosphatase